MEIVQFYYGIVSMQMAYLFFHFFFFRRKEYLYYILFSMCLTCYVFLRTPSESIPLLQWLTLNQIHILGFAILYFAGATYVSFIRHFADSPKLHPQFNQLAKMYELILFGTALTMTITCLLFGKLGPVGLLAKAVYVFNLIAQAYVIIFMLRTKNIFNIYIMTGTFIFGVFVKLSIIPGAFMTDSAYDKPVLYDLFITGSIISYLFLNLTLIFKFRKTEKEKLALEMAKEKSLFQQRMEISNDIHDDMGARLSSLHVYSGLASQLMEQDPVKAKLYLEKISNAVQETMSRLNDVIWAINNTEAEQKMFSSRIKDFYTDIFEAKKIYCTYEIDSSLESKITRIVARKNLLMIAKEAINNAIKHSNADKIILRLKQINQFAFLSVEDNGQSPLVENPNKGHGLKSMRTRAQTLDGELELKHIDGRGTIVTCKVPITSISGY